MVAEAVFLLIKVRVSLNYESFGCLFEGNLYLRAHLSCFPSQGILNEIDLFIEGLLRAASGNTLLPVPESFSVVFHALKRNGP